MRRATAFEITARRPPALGQHNRRNHFRESAGSSQESRSVLLNFENPYQDDELTKRVKRALKSGRKMHIDADGWYVDVKTGELIGPDPAIEQPLAKAQLGKAVVRRGRPPKADRKQTTTLRLDPDLLEHFGKSGPEHGRRGSTRHCADAVKQSVR